MHAIFEDTKITKNDNKDICLLINKDNNNNRLSKAWLIIHEYISQVLDMIYISDIINIKLSA